ncbi:MAG TPA: hypothetical protein VFB92_29930 [Vicinamibacterales bacterium]|jgi:hypothetical protein|nr:hypothetical protein [Vicinamibacterales bacterium]
MMQTVRFACCVALLSVLPAAVGARQTQLAQSKPATVTATIEAIDKANRTVTLKRANGTSVEIKTPPEMQGFNTLKVGDQVTATYFEATAVNVRKPGDPAPPAEPTTVIQRKERGPGSETRRQQTLRFTVRAVDPKAPSLTVADLQGHVVTLAVQEPTRLETLKVGDTVDVTYFESLMISVSRPPK